MKVLIFGSTGFVGKELVEYLISANYLVQVISRNSSKPEAIFGSMVKIINWNFKDVEELTKIVEDTDVIINLAGENISSRLWTKPQKRKILNSRVFITELISKAIEKANRKPRQVIQASAIGYYGCDINKICDENCVKGQGFLADVCEHWESALKVETEIIRTIVRFGVVLGSEGGMLPKIINPIKLYLGSNFGKGNNYISWIHIEDVVKVIGFLIANNKEGIYNLTSPEPVLSGELNKGIARQLNRPVLFNVPKWMLRLFFGEMANELLLANQKVYPQKLIESGYDFKHKNIENALRASIKKGRK